MLGIIGLVIEIAYLIAPLVALAIWTGDWIKDRRSIVSLLRAIGFAIVVAFFVPLVLIRLVDQVDLFFDLRSIGKRELSRFVIGPRVIKDEFTLSQIEEHLRNPSWHFSILPDRRTHTPIVIGFVGQEDLRLEIRWYQERDGMLLNLPPDRSVGSLHWTRGYVYVSGLADILGEEEIPIGEESDQ